MQSASIRQIDLFISFYFAMNIERLCEAGALHNYKVIDLEI